jgi:hypothetical protein
MEVHSHTHTPRKKWTHYFWEFLMLFLAVFCGFLAENQREHLVEHQREKKFMMSLRQDLEHDTAQLSGNIEAWNFFYKNIDTLRTFVEPPFKPENTEKAYYHSALIFNFSEFNYNDRTIEQLRSSGSFRLIKMQRVVDSLVEYDNIIRNTLRNVEAVARNQMQAVISMQSDLFNSKHLEEYVTGVYGPSNPPAHQLYKVENKPEILFRYYNELYKYKMFAWGLTLVNQDLKRRAVSLIELIKKEYHLE